MMKCSGPRSFFPLLGSGIGENLLSITHQTVGLFSRIRDQRVRLLFRFGHNLGRFALGLGEVFFTHVDQFAGFLLDIASQFFPGLRCIE